jgi:hypothetical protein
MAAGVRGEVRIAIQASIFGRWAVHQSRDVDDDPTSKRGYVVTHVESGLAIPGYVVNDLEEYQAEAIASALDKAGDLALSGDSIDEWTKVAILAVIKDTLANLAAMEEVRL